MSRRKESRIFVEIAGRCFTRGGAACAAFISDLSLHGCQMSMQDEDLEPGDQIEIELSAAGRFPARVRWTRSDRDRMLVGAEFEQALHPSLLHHFAAWCRVAS